MFAIFENNLVVWRSFPSQPIVCNLAALIAYGVASPREITDAWCHLAYVLYLWSSVVGDARRDARRPDKSKVCYEQQQPTDDAAELPISSHQHRP